jgi:radical SAM superfamily enzyme YgiQ (UPF0313 family)
MGLLYIASALREDGHEVGLFESGRAWEDADRFHLALQAFRPDVVGISALTQEAIAMRGMAGVSKAAFPDVPVVVGGPHATAYPLRCVRNPDIDFAVIGEGEITFPALVHALTRGGRDPRSIPGVASLDTGGNLAMGGPAETIGTLDELPWPAWDLLDLGFYQRNPSMAHVGRRPYMPMITSRGCPYRCIYCHQVHGKTFRARSPESVMAEAEEVYRRFGIREFEIHDDTFNLNRPRMEAILDGFTALSPRATFHFPNGLRTDLLVESDFPRLRNAGAQFIAVAVEAATPRIQTLIRKNLDLDRVFSNIEHANRAGLYVSGFFMLGFPTEKYTEARATVDFALRSRLHEAMFFVVTPFEGTPLHEMVRERLEAEGHAVPDEDMDYFRGRCNVSAMTDRELFGLQRSAYRRFYANPVRVARVLARHPRPRQLFSYGMLALIKMLPRARGYSRNQESPCAMQA